MSDGKMRIGKTTIGLIGLTVLVSVLVISNGWFYSSLQQVSGLSIEYDSLCVSYDTLCNEFDTLCNGYDSLSASYDSYRATHNYTNAEYNSLKADYDTLQSTYNSYLTTHSYTDLEYNALQNERDSLKAAQLHLINYDEEIHSIIFGTDYVTVGGTIFNSGTYSATNVAFTVRVYNNAMTLIETKLISFGTILGKSYVNFEDVIYAEGAYYVTEEVTSD